MAGNGTAPSPLAGGADAPLLCAPDGSDNLIGLPCSASVMGNLFLMAVYGGLLAYGAERISTGSEKLLEVWGPGLVGGLLLPVLGALPDAMVIAISVLKATDPAKLQEDLNVGMGTLVGSNVVLLTIPWAMTVALGNVGTEARARQVQAHHVRKRKRRMRREKQAKLLDSKDAASAGGTGVGATELYSSSSSSSSSSGSSSTSDSSDASSSSAPAQAARQTQMTCSQASPSNYSSETARSAGCRFVAAGGKKGESFVSAAWIPGARRRGGVREPKSVPRQSRRSARTRVTCPASTRRPTMTLTLNRITRMKS